MERLVKGYEVDSALEAIVEAWQDLEKLWSDKIYDTMLASYVRNTYCLKLERTIG